MERALTNYIRALRTAGAAVSPSEAIDAARTLALARIETQRREIMLGHLKLTAPADKDKSEEELLALDLALEQQESTKRAVGTENPSDLNESYMKEARASLLQRLKPIVGLERLPTEDLRRIAELIESAAARTRANLIALKAYPTALRARIVARLIPPRAALDAWPLFGLLARMTGLSKDDILGAIRAQELTPSG